MTCYYPLKGYRSKDKNPNGKRSIVFQLNQALVDMPVTLPCGQCIGCRLERSRQWAIRCVHEAQTHEDNCFITLTYNDKHLPEGKTLVLADFQKFMKRLRKNYKHKIRFFHCGEYGEINARPHYHAILFGHDFKDKKLWKQERENPLYRSAELEHLWPFGHSSIGSVSFQSAAYVARYIMKKVTGEPAEEHYKNRKPEYTTMSRKNGIGHEWLMKYNTDVFPDDHVIINGTIMQPPKYYDTQLEKNSEKLYKKIKAARIIRAKKDKENQTPERLKVRENIRLSRITQLERNLE